jgi:acetylcholinesterase
MIPNTEMLSSSSYSACHLFFQLIQRSRHIGQHFTGNTRKFYGVDAFLGIPYAKLPIASRFQPPVALDSFGAIDATSYGAECFQLNAYPNSTISEDCVTLSIFKPSESTMRAHSRDCKSRRLPVIVWIHCGGFNDGSGNFYDPSSLVNRSVELEHPIIVVTLNYRLGFFGFPGNLASQMSYNCGSSSS